MLGIGHHFDPVERDFVQTDRHGLLTALRRDGTAHRIDISLRDLKTDGLNNSQIAKKLKISRGSVIGLLKTAA